MSATREPLRSGDDLTQEQLYHLIGSYERALSDLGYTPIEYPDRHARVGSSLVTASRFDCMNHSLWMCGCVRTFVREHRLALAYRWLGMVQGLMFMGGVYSLEELSEQQRELLGSPPGTPEDGCR